MFPKYYSRNNNFGIQSKSLVDLTYREWIFNIKNKPQFAKDPNSYNKPEGNINEFGQFPIKEKEPSPPLQNFFLLLQKKNISNEKNIDTNKAQNQMGLNRKENKKTLRIKKINIEKRLKINNEDMKKVKYAEKKLKLVYCK